MRLEELIRNVEQKQAIMGKVDECRQKMDIQYRLVLQNFPDANEADFVDVQKLQESTDALSAKAAAGFRSFQEAIQDKVGQVEGTDDSTADATLLSEVTTIANDYAKVLEELNIEVGKLANAFAVTPEGKLARRVRSTAKSIERKDDMEIFKLSVALTHKVDS